MFRQKSDSTSSPAASAPADAVQQARTRARHRLIGAAVLLAIGIIGFPLVFETQPRPIPVDIPIEIPRKESMPPLVAPPAQGTAGRSGGAMPASPVDPGVKGQLPTESRSDAGRDITPARSAAASAAAVARSGDKAPVPSRAAPPATPLASASPGEGVPASSVPVSGVVAAPRASTPSDAALAAERRVATSPEGPATRATAELATRPSADGDRARALLEGRSAAVAGEGQRFVVQVGAFADAAAARETRLKVEKLGLKTYTQVAQTASGSRIRVRVGPFTSRGDADTALAKAKAAGLAAVVLTI